ncbi:M10 family metallopeptidase C-terminal domain-containing protein [Castellaniella hirudinis]|uniref:M10 family metallopeptidase C-terminal domain-containing protein n=1 Tax=Castellaniella hirudinis TaxID=1144617 RepID=UPI0039C0EF6A
MALPQWTDQQVFDQMNSGSKWFSPVITYAFPQSTSAFSDPELADVLTGFSPLNAAQQPLAQLGMMLWDDLIAPSIVQGSVHNADILVSNTSATEGYAFALYPRDGGTVWFSSHHDNLQAPKIGEHGFITFVHEIGHALGLNHMGGYNGDDDDGPSSYQDSDMLSIMSYYGPGMNRGEGLVAWGDWFGADGRGYSAQTPMVNDIMVIQEMYGADTTTRVEDTVYGFGSNVQGPQAQIFDFSVNEYPILTIYDAGGVDTLNLSGWGTDSLVNLNPGQYSSVNGMTNNLAIAWTTLIENAVTGAGNDVLRGNAADNYLNGGDGQDSAVFSGALPGYDLSYNVFSREYAVLDLTANRDGTDTLLNIEYANFNGFQANLNDLTPAVYRFYNADLGLHFYTSNNDEATAVTQLNGFAYEGEVFGRSVDGASIPGADTVVVQRFYNQATGDHFYTAGVDEANSLMEIGGAWQYEGQAFNAYGTQADGTTALYRFLNAESGTHFYTADTAEMEAVMQSGHFNYEGIAFYVTA